MKKMIIPIGILFMTGFAYAQTGTENYVQTRTYLEPVTSSNSGAKQINTVQYFDGLGRPKQVVNVKASPSGKDVVTPFVYDAFGRQVKDYLPVPQSSTQNGAIIANPLGNASSVYGSEKIYSEKTLENSPLDRIQQQIQTGNDWTNKPVKFEYGANTVADGVRKFTTATTWENGATKSVLGENWLYPDGQLFKNTVTDEDGNKTTEFKNDRGQVIMVRKTVNGSESADTYYVYNEYSQLAFVVPPLASIRGDIVANTAKHDELCYQYRYDGKNRLVEKKLPGKGWEQMIYNKSGQLVYYRDTNLKNGITYYLSDEAWQFTKYDAFGRVAYTGICRDGTDRNLIQHTLDVTGGAGYETRGESFMLNGMTLEYGNTAYPTYLEKILTVNYYDTYPAFPQGVSAPSSVLGQEVLKQADQSTSVKNTKGLPLASYVKNIEDDNWTKTFNWFDTRGRVIGTRSVNYLGGYTVTESELDFAGVPLQTKTHHKRLNTDTETVIAETFEYDNQNRLLVHKHKVNGNAEEILAQNEYNELSQLKTKKVGGTDISAPLQTVDYAYNIRGWMTGINDPANLNGRLFGYGIKYQNPANTSFASPSYNGNISEVDWIVSNAEVLHRYSYAYDRLNRLTDAVYSNPQFTVPVNHLNDEHTQYDLNGNITHLTRNAKSLAGNFAEMIDDLGYTYEGNRLTGISDASGNPTGYEGGGNTITYDPNGNMTGMPDKNIQNIGYNFLNLPNAFGISGNMNKLMYLYRADGTKLRKITHIKKDQGYFLTINDYLDGFHYLSTEGTPDNTDNPLEFAYEQEAFLTKNLSLTPVPALQFVSTAEGFYDFENNEYIYQYKDHLGNVRISYRKNNETGEAEITDQNDYYPFGMNIPRVTKSVFGTGSPYNYKYNGKELQETGMYDYGARFYMPDIGRWGVIDPKAELGRRWSPYTYAFDNPMMFVDPDGMWPWPTWSQIKSYAKGAWSTGGNMIKGAATSTYTSVTGGVREAKKVYNAYQTGGAKAAAKQYVNSVYETSGAKAIVQTAKGVAKGDAESIGSAVVMVAAVVVTHKAGSPKAAVAAETTASSLEGSQLSRSQMGTVVGGGSLSSDTNVVRGGTCLACQFENGSGVTLDSKGLLNGVSVNSASGLSVEQLSSGIPNGSVGVTTVGEIEAVGGNVKPSPTNNNPNHATLSGITPEQAEQLFNPTIKNPTKSK